MRVEVRLSRRDFVKFSLFDTFFHKKGWLRPALFAAILGTAAGVCFALRDRRGAVLLGTVLLTVALGLPAAWVLSFFLSVRRQAKDQGLAGGKYVYTLDLGDKELAVDNGRERAAYPWARVYRVYRRPDAAYLYVTPQRAFLLPCACVQGGADSLWKRLEGRVPADRRRGRPGF